MSGRAGSGMPLDSASVEVDDGTSLVFSGTYMMTKNWAADILASAPFKHDIDLRSSITAGANTTSGTIPLGDTSHLPPPVSLQYQPATIVLIPACYWSVSGSQTFLDTLSVKESASSSVFAVNFRDGASAATTRLWPVPA